MEIAKNFDPKLVEDGKYQKWLDANYFTAGDKTKPPFSLILPPPNVTGVLHLGHAWDTTFQDIIARYKKAKGFDVMWIPGLDHAGIATQARVEGNLAKQCISRFDLGRKEFLKEAYKWSEDHAGLIHKQWETMGLMLDYTKEKFTLDPSVNKAVEQVFVTLYEQGLIYQGERIINWDPVQETALSNIEVVHKDIKGKFYFFKYYLENSDFYLEVATTRPETMFADVCLVINPKDKRYTKYLNKNFINPVNNELIPLIGDEYVDKEFGTGVMKCTPAHDLNDFIIGEKYKLPMPLCINKNGTLNELGLEFNGLDRFEARKKLVEKMKNLGLLIKVEEIIHSVGHSERSDAIVEPYLSKQWFIKMRPLAEAALANQKGSGKVSFYPHRFEKTFIQWMEKAEDWCISRQLWWGHRIPAYTNKLTGEVIVSITPPSELQNYIQDEDVLDTWFSSGLWPFVTLDWPNNSEDFARYYPLDVLVTGYDIIFFWVSRMIFQSLHFTKVRPFKDVVLHGLIRDKNGKKMSKSLGNGVDPLDVIEKFGTDALRYFLATSSTPGQDMRYIEEKVEASSAYLNKIWNAARYILMTLPADYKFKEIDKKALHPSEVYITNKLNRVIKLVSKNMDKYELGQASTHLYNFVYDDFCSSYLEISKVILANDPTHTVTYDVLYSTLKAIIMMIYPFSPFISEEIYSHLQDVKPSIMEEVYPTPKTVKTHIDETATASVLDFIKAIRNFKANNGIAPNQKIDVYITNLDFEITPFINIIKRIAFVDNIHLTSSDSVLPSYVNDHGKIFFKVLIDEVALKAKLEKDLITYQNEVDRSEKMLSNKKFVDNAPADKLANEQNKYKKYVETLALIKKQLAELT